MVELELTIFERIQTLTMLPTKDTRVGLRVLEQSRNKIDFTEEEIKKFGVVINGGNITWNKESVGVTKKIDIGDYVFNIIKTRLEKLDKDKELEFRQLTLYDKVMEK